MPDSAASLDLSTKPAAAFTSADIEELARRIAARRDTGIAIPGSQVDLYAEAMRALARERAERAAERER
ncbi:hypothetical protein [Methylobacterium sp. Leaf118]|uniref:hypothetical protein n=1 Tax=Methylobacterium sp. Leaf118 TaxID=2876562 RepID=UPI001E61D36C|nr:hypothetical protein [Methylobacterium sp. Leaf118]